jgi:hypothetical protein
MTKKFTFLVFFLALLNTGFCQSNSQTTNEQVFYVQCDDLDFEKYRQLDATVKSNGHFSVITACIPAHVLTVRVNPGAQALSNAAEFEHFRTLCETAGILQTSLLSNYNKQMFEDQCRSARTNH